MNIVSLQKIKASFLWHYQNWIGFRIYRTLRFLKIHRIRSKRKINVLFVLTELGPWKTKELYLTMLRHPRFKPTLGISKSTENPKGKDLLETSLRKNNFDFVDLDKGYAKAFEDIAPDIIFYQKPYDGAYQPYIQYRKHLSSLFCYVYYSFHVNDLAWNVNRPLFDLCWQQYFENTLTASSKRMSLMDDGGKQAVITGLPIQDQLLLPKESFIDSWKVQKSKKKRIIYAPHHTIGGMHMQGLALSSFLENGEFMLEMMHKYSDEVQWAFKPHPLLYKNLVQVWGKEKTEQYYEEWENSENSQFEDGEYDALFKYSDAMIHDCSSFTVEYHYTKNPVLFLIRQDGAENSNNEFCQKAYDLHYKAHTKDQIEQFIINVIDGVDPMKEQREKFYEEFLIPPHGKTACENIINAILGVAEYKDR